MIHPTTRRLVLTIALLGPLLGANGLAAQVGDRSADSTAFAGLIGTWLAEGTGFSSQLTYRWQLPGVMVSVSNELRGAEHQLLARYEGGYYRHPVTGEWRFLTAGGTGELHEGSAVWRDGTLWHEAVLHGGGIAGYSSAVVPTADTVRYHARYTPGPTDASLLELTPLVYVRQRAAPTASRGSGLR